jgi:hypothetical protein
MSNFSEANQVRLALKMKYSKYYWYNSSRVISIAEGFGVIVCVKLLDNSIRKKVSPVVNGISIKAEVD